MYSLWKRNNDISGFIGDLLPTNNHIVCIEKILHHVGMIWMIEKHEDLKYDMEL